AGEGGGHPSRPWPPAVADALVCAPARAPSLRDVHQVRRAASCLRRGRGARSHAVRGMIGYVLGRIGRAVLTLLATTFIIFALVRWRPADPAVSVAGPKADPDTLAAIRKDLGLDDPVPVRYVRYLGQLLRGDLGRSYMTTRRVSDVIWERVPRTALL